jgi:hypothetical protein
VWFSPAILPTPIWTKSLGLAEQMLQQLPEKAHVLYGPTMSAALSTARKMSQRAAPPQTVSKAIIRALTASKPRARYMVGWDARFRLALENSARALAGSDYHGIYTKRVEVNLKLSYAPISLSGLLFYASEYAGMPAA